ncbi:MAG: hypothetical protein PHD95_05305 [Candidatus ainarchaeum sp.]|nr:hypothetical protein [Candidatus ainarchaeum sp.]
MATDKEALFRVYDYIYSKGFGGVPCCKNCNGCERKNYVILYPYEEEYLSKRCGKNIFNKSISLGKGTKICDCNFDIGGQCAIYSHRPIDCRTYPFVLRKSNKGLRLCIDEWCPAAKNIMQSQNHLEEAITIARKLITAIKDPGFWKILSALNSYPWDESMKAKEICKIYEEVDYCKIET